MLSGAFRAAGDSRTPLRLGVLMTALTIAFNLMLIPIFGTLGAALGTVASSTFVAALRRVAHDAAGIGHPLRAWHEHARPISRSSKSLFRFGLPTGVQGIAMNVAGVMLLRFIGSLEQSAAAQAAYAVGYTELFSFITWTSVGLMGAAATIAGQNLGAGRPDRVVEGVWVASRIGLWRRRRGRRAVPGDAATTAWPVRHERSRRARHRHAAAAVPRGVGSLHHRRRSASPARSRARATRAARSTSRSCRRSACRSASARCSRRLAACSRRPASGRRSCSAT